LKKQRRSSNAGFKAPVKVRREGKKVPWGEQGGKGRFQVKNHSMKKKSKVTGELGERLAKRSFSEENGEGREPPNSGTEGKKKRDRRNRQAEGKGSLDNPL